MPVYKDILDSLKTSFPSPVSNRVHDSYLAHTLMRAIDRVDSLKGSGPVLGTRRPADYDAARKAQIEDEPMSLEDVTASLVDYLQGMALWGHPLTQQNVIPPPSIASLVGMLIAQLYNPNLAWDEFSYKVALAEVEAVSMTAALVGYDSQQAAGLFTFGGTGTNLYGVKAGLEKACPGTMVTGTPQNVVMFASDCSHYCRFNVAGWLGMGTQAVIDIPTDDQNEMDVAALGLAARKALAEGKKIAAIVCTMGTTDSFGLDDVEAVVKLRDELVAEFNLPYRPHVHADAVIGWAWTVFNDYDFTANPLGFGSRTRRALAGIRRRLLHLSMADSVGIDFHKTGFTPYVSSAVLFKNKADLDLLSRNREEMPYLYQFGEYHPGMFTLETSRAGTGALAALANLKLFGKQGWQAILGHIVEMSQLLREHLEGNEATSVLNEANHGPVTLFRAYPPGVDTFEIEEKQLNDPAYRDKVIAYNDYNRRIAQYLHDEAMEGRGVVISITDCYRMTDYGEPVLALKSYIVSPFVDEAGVQTVVSKVLESREKLGSA